MILEHKGNLHGEVGNVRDGRRVIEERGWDKSECCLYTDIAWRNLPSAGTGARKRLRPCETTGDGIRVFRHAWMTRAWRNHHLFRNRLPERHCRD